MRKMEYTTPYMCETITPILIKEAVEFLLNQDLFIEKKIQFSPTWHLSENYQENFIVDPDDKTEFESGKVFTNNYSGIESSQNNLAIKSTNSLLNSSASEEDDDIDDNNEDFFAPNNYLNIDQPTLLDNAIVCAPGEGNFPKSIAFDDASEELTFLKIYGGKRAAYPDSLSYAAICKSEFRRYDRRCATNITKLFYSYKKLVACKLIDSINTSLQKTNKTTTLTAQQALCQERMEKFFSTNEARLFLRTIRSSPQFWEWKKSEINAMIRQLGCPTFFITFSPAEVNWFELIVVIAKVVHGKTITIDEAKNINKDVRVQLLNTDPVTVARYFENRIFELLKYMNSPVGPFSENMIKDYFWRVDFQYRGSPHVHMFTWNENSPKYLTSIEIEEEYNKNMKLCCDFINKYITCETPENSEFICECQKSDHETFDEDTNETADEDIITDIEYNNTNERNKSSIKYQLHKHKLNCKLIDKFGNRICKYGFPWPILEETLILEPLGDDYSKDEKQSSYDTFITIKHKFEKVDKENKYFNIYVSLKDFLNDMNITYQEYILAFRSSINKSTVFLKRTCRDLMTNPYNKSIFLRHRANMDIQFETDPYGAASYVTAYMLKSNAVMSTLLKKASSEMQKGLIKIYILHIYILHCK